MVSTPIPSRNSSFSGAPASLERAASKAYGARVKQFPARTIILMVLTLASFVWFWLQLHRAPRQPPPVPPAEPLKVQVLAPGGDS